MISARSVAHTFLQQRLEGKPVLLSTVSEASRLAHLLRSRARIQVNQKQSPASSGEVDEPALALAPILRDRAAGVGRLHGHNQRKAFIKTVARVQEQPLSRSAGSC